MKSLITFCLKGGSEFQVQTHMFKIFRFGKIPLATVSSEG